MADQDNDLRREYGRWTELMDRQAIGEVLSSDELAFCSAFGAEHPSCVRETALLDELALLDVPPSVESRALVDAALARLAAESLADGQGGDDEAPIRLERARRGRWLGGAAAVAAAAAIAFSFVQRRPPAPPDVAVAPTAATRVELVYAAGEVRIDGVQVHGGSTLLGDGSTISVGRGSACVAMDPEINMCAGDNTVFRLADLRHSWRRIDLDAGKLAVQLAPQPEGYHLSIVSDGVWSTAVGTAFSVERDPTTGVQTTVMQGKVRVGRDRAREQIVTAHQRAQVKGAGTRLTAMSRSDESPEWALLGPSRLWNDPVSATLELRGLPPGAQIWLDGQGIGPAPLSTLIPAGSHAVNAIFGGKTLGTREFVAEVGQLTVISFDLQALQPSPSPVFAPERPSTAVAAKATAAAPSGAEPTPTAAAMLGEARRLMVAAQFREAAAQYQALRSAYPESPEAQTVLVSLAELQVDRLKQPSAALLNVERYLSGEHAALAEEAQKVRIRALRAIGDEEHEAEAIEEFLKAHPRSFQSSALARRLAEITKAR